LLEGPINQTLSNLAQALEFLVANNFLDGVELNAGEYQEACGYAALKTENLVEVVPEDRDAGRDDGVEGETGVGST
jgi:hypothetical protein